MLCISIISVSSLYISIIYHKCRKIEYFFSHTTQMSNLILEILETITPNFNNTFMPMYVFDLYYKNYN